MSGETSRRLVVFTGSGISADSGLDTFRTSGGQSLWAQYDPQVVCNFECWEDNFDLVHDFYSRRREELAGVEPNDAHRLVVDWEKRYNAELITQNVDDLFERAGARYVMHVHGFLSAMRCVSCGAQWLFGYKRFSLETDRCPRCGRLESVKPNVVFFNEPAPRYAEMWKILGSLTRNDVLVAIGTSGLVLPIGAIARDSAALTVLSNLQSAESPRDEDFDFVLHGRAADIAPQLDALVRELMEK
ncbi:MAG TPA: Sir2 family NAD-dependent protein deacetylase [Rhodoblastus sp.]|nr:Sir2 family NAD-dependent protein deacetylase [Rhodoblastus sp.]